MKVKYGLKNVHYAMVNEVSGVIDFGTLKKIPGAVNLTMSAVGDPVEFYADDELYFNEEVNNGYDGDLEIALVPQSFQVDILGDVIDSNGVQVERSSQTGKKFALLFEFATDVTAKRHVLYYCSAKRPDVESGSKKETKEIKTETFAFKSRPLPGTTDVKANSTPDTNPTAYANWYSAVYQPDTSFVPVTLVAVAGAGDVDTVVEGNTLAMIATITPANATDPRVVWSVETLVGGVATINSLTGVLTAVTDGTVTVTATTIAGAVVGTKSITITNI